MTNTETTTAAPTVNGSTATDKPVGAKARKAATKPSKPVVTKTTSKADKPAAKATKAAKAKPAAKKAAKAKPTGAATGSVIPKEYRSQYTRTKIEVKVKGDDGKSVTKAKSVIDNGDDVASLLRGRSLDEVYKVVAKQTKLAESDLRAKYQHLNVGMQRMCIGNKLRAALSE